MISITEIKNKTNITSIISAIVDLNHRGNRSYGLCPFHDETAGSFVVYADRQRFHCFGCNEQGDVLDFMQRYHGISLTEACKILNPGFKATRKRRIKPTAAQKHKKLCNHLDIWKALYFDNLPPSRRQKIIEYCIDNWQPWQRPEHFKLIFYRQWKRRMKKHPALWKIWKRNVREYQMRRKLLDYF